jgi:hypothetical protein
MWRIRAGEDGCDGYGLASRMMLNGVSVAVAEPGLAQHDGQPAFPGLRTQSQSDLLGRTLGDPYLIRSRVRRRGDG